jgi:YD repeat-containing protein
MKSVFIALSALAFSTSILANSVASPSSSTTTTTGITVPKLQFDNKGRLILVVTPEGRNCAYQYGKDGGVISPIDSSCGDPQVWLKPK